MVYEYEGSVDFRGETAAALERAGHLLIAAGFNALPPSGSQLWFTNPGSYLNTKNKPLMMVSKGSITATGSALSLHAELGNLQALVKFLILLVGVMAIPETAMLAVILVMVAKQPELLWVCLLSVVPIPFVWLAMPKIQGRATGRALDALLARIASDTGAPPAMAAPKNSNGKMEPRYWFHAKKSGFGWGLPASPEGWVVLVGYCASVALGALLFPPDRALALFLPYMAVITILLIVVCVIKGEPLRR